MKANLKRLGYLLGTSIEEIILIGIILLNILDFIELLSPDWDYAKKILSWTALGYLLYKADLTMIFFGKTDKKVNLILILSFFSLTFKNMIAYAISSINEITLNGFKSWGLYQTGVNIISKGSTIVTIPYEEFSKAINGTPSQMDTLAGALTINADSLVNDVFVNVTHGESWQLVQIETAFPIHRWFNFLIDNSQMLIEISITVGLISLFTIAVYAMLQLEINRPSTLAILKDLWPGCGKFGEVMLTFFLFNAFFVIIFNLMMEWLAIAIDAPLLVIALLFYLLVWIKHHKKFSTNSLIFRLGNLGEGFYTRFIQLLKTKDGILLGVSGMLVLHLLTDIGIFLIPYTIGIHDSLYFRQFMHDHNVIFNLLGLFGFESNSLFIQDTLGRTMFEIIPIFIIYALNIITILMLLLIPTILWYIKVRRVDLILSKYINPLLISCFAVFLLSPAFRIKRIGEGATNIVGVDILTQSITSTAKLPFMIIIVISIILFFGVLILERNDKLKTLLTEFSILLVLLFFGYYITLYFFDIIIHYANFILESFKNINIATGIYFLFLMFITSIFYIGGFISYIYELLRPAKELDSSDIE